MAEESRRPHGHAQALDEAVVCAIVRLKQAHPHWGPRKIHALYLRQHSAGPAAHAGAEVNIALPIGETVLELY